MSERERLLATLATPQQKTLVLLQAILDVLEDIRDGKAPKKHGKK